MADTAPDLAADLIAALSAVPDGKVASMSAAPQPAVSQPSASPPKRARETEQHDDSSSSKRQKTGYSTPGREDQQATPASWDISAMIENALGSLDDQLPPAPTQNHTAPPKDSESTVASQPRAVTPRKTEQKRMSFSSNPYYMMRTMSLPLLGSLAVQTLLALSQQSREETEALLADVGSEYRRAYDLLKSTMEHARRIFSDKSPVLSADELEISDSEDRETIRMANLAALSTSIFQGDDDLLPDGHDTFTSIFIPEDGDLTDAAATLCLSLKTQAFLRILKHAESRPGWSDALDKYFPTNADDAVKKQFGDSPFGVQERERLISGIKSLRQTLLESVVDESKRPHLAEQYPFSSVVDSLSAYLQSHLPTIIEYAEKYGINIPISEDVTVSELLNTVREDPDHDELSLLLRNATSGLVPEKMVQRDTTALEASQSEDPSSDSLGLGKLIQDSLLTENGTVKGETSDTSTANATDTFESQGLASLIASKLSNGFGSNSDTNSSHPSPYRHSLHPSSGSHVTSSSLAQLNQLSQTPYYTYNQVPPPQPTTDTRDLPPNQSHPTAVLYERARQAAVAKSSSTARREGLHSTRRAWTPEEEKALMQGLDMVKGPHWSQILTLFGQNGTISDILKDRTQVQLKDKARNLKLFFLKTNSEMPYYLQCVTGELKTRAPSQAARKEAEERARMNSEEEQGRMQAFGAMPGMVHTHAQNHSSPGPNSAPSTSTRTSPVASSTEYSTSGQPVFNTAVASSPRDVQVVPTMYPAVKIEAGTTQTTYQPRPERQLQPSTERIPLSNQTQENHQNGDNRQIRQAQTSNKVEKVVSFDRHNAELDRKIMEQDDVEMAMQIVQKIKAEVENAATTQDHPPAETHAQNLSPSSETPVDPQIRNSAQSHESPLSSGSNGLSCPSATSRANTQPNNGTSPDGRQEETPSQPQVLQAAMTATT
ncbi:hypothetical protein VTK73DRAFT_100 [Phialemonium thermophilum]|uniref:HTH myb-type domain-containing protein n=1 Tax=Phialemonium thermophilum TaxID=223376 RepID=A0ABR3Y510_9PEZI